MKRHYYKSAAVLLAVLPLALNPARVFGQKGASSCPLSEAQSRRAIDAWAKIADFLTSEPRCVNCHGRVNPYIDDVGLDPEDPEAPVSLVEHGGGKQFREHNKGSDGTGEMDRGCTTCHDDMAPGGGTNWTLAPDFDSFVDKDATTLCRQIKRETRTAEHFLGHLQNDNGGINFGGTAFMGNRGLGKDSLRDYHVKIQKPSLTHDALMQLARDWIAAMGGKFQGDISCGCELTHDEWSGMIRYVVENTGDQGQDRFGGSWSNKSLSMITVNVKNGVATVRYTVQEKNAVSSKSGGSYGMPINHTTSTTDVSAEKTIAGRVDVLIYQGSYQVLVGGYTIFTVGKRHYKNCDDLHGCQTADGDVYPLTLPPPRGKVKDPNRIQDSVTQKTEGLGRSQKGIEIKTTTVDLWRTQAKY